MSFLDLDKGISTVISLFRSTKVCFNKKKSVHFLGVALDENLSWKSHINNICIKISKSIGIIHRSRFYLSKQTKLSLYYTLVYPYLSYCNVVWSSTYATNINRIFLLQKRAVRSIANATYCSHSAPIFSSLKVLDIFKIISFHIAKFMFLFHHCLLPPSLLGLFVANNQIHSYHTRTADDYRPHACRTNIKLFTILFEGPKV